MTRRSERTRAGRTSRVCALLPCLVVALAACSTPTSVPPGDATAPSTSDRPVLPPDHRSIPVRVVHGAGGADCLVTDMAVGYEPDVQRITVAVDAGSSGVVVTPDAIRGHQVGSGVSYPNGLRDLPSAPVDLVSSVAGFYGSDDQRVASLYGGGDVLGSLRSDALTSGLAARCGPVRGVTGIAIGNAGPGRPELDSPLSHLDRPLSDGVALALAGDTGTITAGPPEVSPRSVVLPLTRVEGTSPTSGPIFQRVVTLCWTVGTARGCGPTTLGTGPDPVLRPDLLPTGGAAVPDGTPVSISMPDGAVLDSFTTGAPGNRLTYANPTGDAVAATGLGLLRRYTVGFDTEAGRAVLTPR